jgi:hypothetical protein
VIIVGKLMERLGSDVVLMAGVRHRRIVKRVGTRRKSGKPTRIITLKTIAKDTPKQAQTVMPKKSKC